MYPKNHLWLSTTARQCSIQRHVVLAAAFACLITNVMLQNPSAAVADNWTMSMTVDNQYNVYFGDQFLSSPTFVGGGANWTVTDTWNISGVASNAFLYVATASDQQVAQGFIGEFTNTTTSHSFVTSAASGTPWQVFAAGAFLPQLHTIDPSIPSGVWPPSLQPTQTQVQEAVTYATLHSLWLAPDSAPGYTNGANPLPWGTRPGLPANAEWIWHNAGTVPPGPYPVPFNGGNEAEFLVFRIAGAAVPEPSTLCLAGIGLIWSLGLAHRRKFGPASLRHRARHVAQRFQSGASAPRLKRRRCAALGTRRAKPDAPCCSGPCSSSSLR